MVSLQSQGQSMNSTISISGWLSNVESRTHFHFQSYTWTTRQSLFTTLIDPLHGTFSCGVEWRKDFDHESCYPVLAICGSENWFLVHNSSPHRNVLSCCQQLPRFFLNIWLVCLFQTKISKWYCLWKTLDLVAVASYDLREEIRFVRAYSATNEERPQSSCSASLLRVASNFLPSLSHFAFVSSGVKLGLSEKNPCPLFVTKLVVSIVFRR